MAPLKPPNPLHLNPQQGRLPPNPNKPAPVVNHPAVHEYVSQWNQMAHEVDRLTAENRQLKYDLDCARHMITELQHISDHERAKKETYQRWATRFDTLAGEIADLSKQLRDEARQAAAPEPESKQIEGPAPIEEPLSPEELEQQVRDIAKKFSPKPDGSAGHA
jgi:predicted RNase H-like nuclease (RuvC/YqgF family)